MTKMHPLTIIAVLPLTIVLALILCATAGACLAQVAADEAQPAGDPPPGYLPRDMALLDNAKLLVMIRETENWDGDSEGASGERGPWQMLVSTWKSYSSEHMPYTRRSWSLPEPQRVLHCHASWIRDQMEKRHLPQNAYTFALFWKAGYGRIFNTRCRVADLQYAQRAQNIYDELTK